MKAKASNFQSEATINGTKLLYTVGQKSRWNIHPYEYHTI